MNPPRITVENRELATRRVTSPAELGALIRSQRKRLGHTQAEAATLCGVGVRFLSELERGKRTAELGLALKVARRLGLDLWLAARDGERFWEEGS